MDEFYDVVAISLTTGARRIMERRLTKQDADAYIAMAVARRGMDDEFFKAAPSDSADGQRNG